MMTKADTSLEAQWAKEAESRLAAYRRGEISAIPLTVVLAKYTSKPASRSLRRQLDHWNAKLRAN